MNRGVCDYFFVIGADSDVLPAEAEIREQTHSTGSNDWFRRAYKTAVLSRYPEAEHADAPFPGPGLSLFCFPEGYRFTDEPDMPKVHFFSATFPNGERLYGSCLVCYESINGTVREKLEAIQQSELNGYGSGEGDGSDSSDAEEDEEEEAEEEDEDDARKDINKAQGKAHNDEELQGEGESNRGEQEQSASESKEDSSVEVRKVVDLSRVYAPKAIGLISHEPFLDGFRRFLTFLYRKSLSTVHIPIERLVCNFVSEVPMPPRGQCEVQYSLDEAAVISFSRPPMNDPISERNISIRTLFEYLDMSNIEKLLVSVLLERPILLVSSQLSLLTVVCETVTSLIFPFQWQHVYIPMLPKQLLDFLNAPTPFIAGIHSSYASNINLSTEVCVFNLDSNQASTMPIPQFPSKERGKLLKALKPLSRLFIDMSARESEVNNRDFAFAVAPPPDQIDSKMAEEEVVVKEAEFQAQFYRLFVSLFKNYREFLIFPSKEPMVDPHHACGFDKQGFLKSNAASNHAFLKQFLETQAFQAFVELRTHPNPNDTDVLYFDESITAKKNRSRFQVKKHATPFLNDKTHSITKVFVSPSPDLSGLPESKEYLYPEFPVLDPLLFNEPRYAAPISSSMIMGRQDSQRFGSFREVSSEAAIYSVWFIVFTAIVSEKELEHCLEEAFHMLRRMSLERIKPEHFIFRLLIDACGACKVPHKAMQVLHEMELAGYHPTASTYSALLQVFFVNGDHDVGYQTLADLKKNKIQEKKKSPAREHLRSLVQAVDEVKSNLNPALSKVYFGRSFEDMFPSTSIKIDDTCGECDHPLSDKEIQKGWSHDINDYTTTCPYCGEKFVARFEVTFSSPREPHEARKESCVYMSPYVLKKELATLIENEGPSYFASSCLMEQSPACFWNVIVHMSQRLLPIDVFVSAMLSEQTSGNEAEEGSEGSPHTPVGGDDATHSASKEEVATSASVDKTVVTSPIVVPEDEDEHPEEEEPEEVQREEAKEMDRPQKREQPARKEVDVVDAFLSSEAVETEEGKKDNTPVPPVVVVAEEEEVEEKVVTEAAPAAAVVENEPLLESERVPNPERKQAVEVETKEVSQPLAAEEQAELQQPDAEVDVGETPASTGGDRLEEEAVLNRSPVEDSSDGDDSDSGDSVYYDAEEL